MPLPFRRTARPQALPTATSTTEYSSLESRQMYAGFVVANFNPITADLNLIGDGAANQVEVTRTAAGNVQISGLGGTLINGVPILNLPTATLGNVDVRLALGSDSIAVRDIFFQSFTMQEAGVGRENVVLDRVRSQGPVTINTAAGQDQINVEGLFAGNVFINSGISDDQVRVSGRIGVELDASGNQTDRYVFGGPFGGNRQLRITTDTGNDEILLDTLDVDGTVTIDAGAHDDHLGTRVLRVANGMNVSMQGGKDTVNYTTSQVGGNFWTNLQSGDDSLTVDQPTLVFAGNRFRVDGGLGLDTVDRGGVLLGIYVNVETLL